ncbi:hypothetical protein Gocc_2929 [Gaiella occulta]|uniref:Uncharacterized protein n=1 Tax=Gaiella occulta TaxID=1002870 RepID=A0A7M2YUN3_9ACTN|nr:hypothetical protein [Gaiella occulta]RDI73329.1 hypothetical protein Gocc_2929 [Gaiella occulta]
MGSDTKQRVRPLSRAMEDLLLRVPGYEHGFRLAVAYAVSSTTFRALVDRGLVEWSLAPVVRDDGRMSATRHYHWRRTLSGDAVALEISLARERQVQS